MKIRHNVVQIPETAIAYCTTSELSLYDDQVDFPAAIIEMLHPSIIIKTRIG